MTTKPLLDKQRPTRTIIQPEHLLSSLLQSARQLIPFDMGVLALWDAEREALVPFYEDSQTPDGIPVDLPPILQLGSGIIGHVAQTCQPLYIPDVQKDPRYVRTHSQTRSELAVPILLNDQLLGVFNLESNELDAYEKSHIAILQALADQAALVIETTRLYTRLRANYDQLRDAHSDMALRNEISRLSTSDTSLDERLPRLAFLLAQLVDAEVGLITLWDDQTYNLHVRGNWCSDDRILPETLGAIETAIADTLIDTGKPLLLNDVMNLATLSASENGDVHSILALPLIARQSVFGIVLLMRTTDRRSFLAQNLQHLQTPVNQIALGIDNQRLLNQTQAHLSQSRTLLNLAEIAASSMNLDDVLRHVLELTKTMLNVKAGTILIFDRHEGVLMPLWDGFGFPDEFYQLRFPVNAVKSMVAVTFNIGHPQYTNDINTLTGVEHELAAISAVSNLLVVPLRVQNQPLGVFVVAGRQPDFSEEEAHLLVAIGSHVASAFRNLEYIERVRLFKGLSQVVQRVSAELASEQVLIAACQSVVEAIEGVDHAGIVLNYLAPTSGTVVAEYPLRGGIGQPLQLQGYQVYEQMVKTLGPIVVNDVITARDFLEPNYDIITGMGIKSLMVVPLIVQNEFIGSIGIDATQQAHHFSSAEIEVMSAVASQLAISIRNAELFEQLEAQTEELVQANQLKSEFLAKMSHELRTPMNSILGFSDTLLTGIYGELNDKQRDRLERIQRSGHNLLALIDDLLDISRIEAGRMELTLQTVNLKDEIRACLLGIESQVQARNLRLEFSSPEFVPPITADPLRIRQIINNLLSNATKFTEQGRIIVRVYLQQLRNEQGHVTEEIWTSVSDTGIGINEADFDLIFDEFRQADESTTRVHSGTGLGLAITRHLVEMMGGHIWVQSEIGKGSTFTFSLPINRDLPPLATT